jgi:hypothetical protein
MVANGVDPYAELFWRAWAFELGYDLCGRWPRLSHPLAKSRVGAAKCATLFPSGSAPPLRRIIT